MVILAARHAHLDATGLGLLDMQVGGVDGRPMVGMKGQIIGPIDIAAPWTESIVGAAEGAAPLDRVQPLDELACPLDTGVSIEMTERLGLTDVDM